MIPKSIDVISEQHNLTVNVIRYTYNGIRLPRKGYDLVKDNVVLIELEPRCSTPFHPEKWIIHVKGKGSLVYAKRLSVKLLGSILNN